MTITTPATPLAAMSIATDHTIQLKRAQAYPMDSIWVSPEDVIQAVAAKALLKA